VSPYLGPSDGDKKESRWQNHGKRKPLLTTVQKVQESQKNQDNQKKAARKAQPRRALLKKVRPTATVAVKLSSASLPAQPEAAGPMPSMPARSAPAEERIGVVTHYYNHLSVAIMRLESGTLRVGDMIHIRGHTTDFTQRVESLQVDHAPATEVRPSDEFGLKVASTRASTMSCSKCGRSTLARICALRVLRAAP
jgi:hypothetical protein